jgi:hypothetical protein
MEIVNHILWDCQFNIDPQVMSNINSLQWSMILHDK